MQLLRAQVSLNCLSGLCVTPQGPWHGALAPASPPLAIHPAQATRGREVQRKETVTALNPKVQ